VPRIHPIFPDQALSEIFLSSFVKRELRGSVFQSPEELLAQVHKLLDKISSGILLSVFHGWIAWCEHVIAIDGDYFE
jgi:hypothetical protein